MRSIIATFILIAMLALSWSTQAYFGAYWNVHRLDAQGSDNAAVELALLRKGPAAFNALRRGLGDDNPFTALRCAKLLMQMGESDGEEYLLSALKYPDPAAENYVRMAEASLLTAWDARNGPDENLRRQLHEVENNPARVPETLVLFNACLNRYPAWADGYARRARLFQQGGEALEARRDALAALSLAPNHFEARVTLGRVELSVDAPYLAYKSFEHALSINPRLKPALKRDFDEASKALEIENAKRREERRKNTPIA